MHAVGPMGRVYAIWIQESDKDVWHGMVRRVSGTPRYVGGCGWELTALRGTVWPVKQEEEGPPAEDRCHSCVNADPPISR